MSPWEPGPRLLGNLYIIILGTLTTFTWKTWDPCREPWRNLEGTFWEPFGNREGTLRNLGNLGNLERTLGTLGTLSEPWEPWEPLLGNLGTFTWEPLLGNLGTFTWEPLLGTWEPWGNGFWSCSGLLRNLYYGWRPQSILLLGKNAVASCCVQKLPHIPKSVIWVRCIKCQFWHSINSSALPSSFDGRYLHSHFGSRLITARAYPPYSTMVSSALSILLFVGAQAGIYPENHWDFSTELTADTADAFVKENVDAGKTVTWTQHFFGPWLSLKLQTCHCNMVAMLVFFVLSPMLIMLPSVDPKKYPNGRQEWLHLQHSHSIPLILSCGISSAYFNNIHTSFYHVLSISVYR